MARNKIRNVISDKINLKFPAFKYKVVKISDTAAVPHNAVSQKQPKTSSMFMEMLRLTEALLVAG